MKAVAHVDPAIDADVRHLIARYVWALDTADLTTLATLFTADCLVQDTSGARHAGRDASMAYFGRLTALPVFRGRRHHIDNLVYLTCGDRCRIKAYWMVEKWDTKAGQVRVEVVGHSEDLIVVDGGERRFAERVLHHWRDVDGPWFDGAPQTT